MIRVTDLSFDYKNKRIIEGLSFSAKAGECVVLAGPNGSGKSTALALIAGVLRPRAGQIEIHGRVGYVPQGTALFEDMSVEDNLRFFGGSSASPREPLPFALNEYRKSRVSSLSGGLKKQVSISCALLQQPELLLLDEPCAALDAAHRAELAALIREKKAAGCCILYVAHEPTEFESYFDRLIFFGREYREYTRAELMGESESGEQLCREFTKLFFKH